MSEYYNLSWDETKLRYWKQDGKWQCAVPRDDFATKLGYDWKHYGIIGRGKTRELALDDWRKWVDAARFVSDIY